jgi:hypothetical protein
MPIGCQARSSPSARLSQARVLAKMPESAKHSCGTLVRGRGEDKLGMMCLCQRGRWICASFPLASAQTGHTEHCSEAVRDPGMTPQPFSFCGFFHESNDQGLRAVPTYYTRDPCSSRFHHVYATTLTLIVEYEC